MTVARRALRCSLVVAPLACLALACAPSDVPPTGPDAPTVVAPESPTGVAIQVLRGTKPASTYIEINGLRAGDLDESTSWSAEVSLEEGLNSFGIVARDGLGRRSSTTTTSVLLDVEAPQMPTVDVPDYPTLQSVWALTGRADSGASVLVGGAVALDRGADGSFELDLPLSLGANEVRVTAVDAQGNESAAASVTLVRTTFSFSAEPRPTVVPSTTLTLRGSRGAGVDISVNGALRVPRDDTGGPWAVDVTLAPGANTLEVVGSHPEGEQASATFQVRSDTEAPPPPTLDALADIITTAHVTLSGTRAADSAVVVNGVVVAPLDAATEFTALAPLALGLNTLDVRARDEAGNESPPVTPAPVLYRDPNGIHLVVAAVPARVAAPALTLEGTKAGNAAVYVDDTEAAAADGSSAWSHALTLSAGVNTIDVDARVGAVSRTVTVVVEYLPDEPAAASVTLPLYVADARLIVDGVKPAGTGVLRGDGSPVAVVDESEAFHDELTLAPGANVLSWLTRDAFGRLGPAAGGTVTLDVSAPTVVVNEPSEGEVVGALFDLQGTVSDDGEVSSVELCLGSGCLASGSWQPASLDQGAFSALVTTDAQPEADGTVVELYLRASDAAGNVTIAPARELMLLREPLAASADASFADASEDLDLDVGPAREVYAAFHHPSAHGGDVYLLVEDGLTFSGLSPTLLSGVDYGASSAPRVAADDAGVAHLVWLADGANGSGSPGSPGVVYRNVDGPTLSSPLVLEGGGGCDALDIAVSPSGLIAVVWRRALTVSTYAIELVVYTTDWSGVFTVAADGDGLSAAPDLPALAFADDDTLHIAWQDEGSFDGSADDADVLHRSWSQSGGLGAVTLVSDSSGGLVDGSSRSPRLAAVPASATGAVWIGWIESGAVSLLGAGADKAVVRQLSTGGSGLVRDASDVSGRTGVSDLDVAVAAEGELVVVFVANGNVLASGDDSDVFLRASPGAFSDVVGVSDRQQNTVSTGESRRPRLAVDAFGNAHVLWLEASDLTGTIAGPLDTDALYFALGENQR